MEISLHKLGQVIAECWERAETVTAKAVGEEFPQPAEEDITFLFSGKLRVEVDEASKRGEFERALLADLALHFRDHTADALVPFKGLIARVNFHSRLHEGRRSGADIGVVLIRPSVHVVYRSGDVQVTRDRARALMAQAKLGRPHEKRAGSMSWGRLTKAQERLIPTHQNYYALLLYRLCTGRVLAPFRWQLCRGRTVDEIQGWLRAGTFPREVPSGDVIRALSAGTVGTDSQSVVDLFIDPSESHARAVEIRVFWPEGTGPPRRMSVQHGAKQLARQLARA